MTENILYLIHFVLLFFSLQITKEKQATFYSRILTKCQVRQNFFDLPFTSHILT